jgi:hypothetical protein
MAMLMPNDPLVLQFAVQMAGFIHMEYEWSARI